jgi:hypothetical protein
MSEYTKPLRERLKETTDYSEEYEKMFGDFADKKLPKDDLYYSIKTEMESNEKAVTKKRKKDQKNPNANILPPVKEDRMGTINAEQDKLEK